MNQKQNKSSRELILERISQVTDKMTLTEQNTAFVNEDIFRQPDDLLATFQTEIEMVNGKCYLTESETDMIQKLATLLKEKGLPFFYAVDPAIINQLQQSGIRCETGDEFFNDMQAGITGCEFLIARTGSVLVSSGQLSGRRMHAFPPVHVVLAHEDQLVHFVEDGLIALQKKYAGNMPSAITLITGPSRTADIEKTLVMGAHGPKELIIFVQRKHNQKV